MQLLKRVIRRSLRLALRQPRLLGYAAAGVAVPIRDGGELLASLDDGRARSSSEARASFLGDHFAPGAAGQRIRDDLEAWLIPTNPHA